MELLQLRYFYKIAHSRTLTQAADELCISQSSLSRMIGRLEDEFEMEFFDRKGRKIELNENGRIFLRYCTQILNAVDSMRDELSEMKNRRDMAVSVGFYSMSSLIVDIMGKFKERYPNINLRVLQHYHEDNSISSLDLIVNSAVPGEEPENSTVLLEEDILLAVPKSCDVCPGGVLRLSDLADIKIASLVRGRPVRDITEKYVKQAGARLNISFETDSPVTLRRIISQGMAPAFFPEKTWELDDYSAVEFRRFDPPCRRTIYVRWNRPYYKGSAAVLFYEFLKEYFKET